MCEPLKRQVCWDAKPVPIFTATTPFNSDVWCHSVCEFDEGIALTETQGTLTLYDLNGKLRWKVNAFDSWESSHSSHGLVPLNDLLASYAISDSQKIIKAWDSRGQLVWKWNMKEINRHLYMKSYGDLLFVTLDWTMPLSVFFLDRFGKCTQPIQLQCKFEMELHLRRIVLIPSINRGYGICTKRKKDSVTPYEVVVGVWDLEDGSLVDMWYIIPDYCVPHPLWGAFEIMEIGSSEKRRILVSCYRDSQSHDLGYIFDPTTGCLLNSFPTYSYLHYGIERNNLLFEYKQYDLVIRDECGNHLQEIDLKTLVCHPLTSWFYGLYSICNSIIIVIFDDDESTRIRTWKFFRLDDPPPSQFTTNT